MIGKNFYPAITLLGLAALFSPSVHADTVYYATPTVLEFTVKKFELCSDPACSSPVVLRSTTATFDVASAGAGASIGDYAADASIPRGVRYPYARITMSRTFTVEGAANVPNVGTAAPANMAAAACYTKTGNPITGDAEIETGTADAATNLAAAVAAATPQAIKLAEGEAPEGEILISEVYTADDVIAVYPLSSSIYLDPNSAAPEISISFDVTNAMSFSADGTDCIADEEPPSISISVN